MALQPGVGGGVLAVGQRVEKMPVEFRDARVVELAHHGQEAGLVRRDLEVGGAEQEGLVAFVGAAVEQVGGLGVGARHDDARHPHDVELEACGVQALDLFVRGNQNLAALMAALLRAGPLVLDVVPGHAGLDEAANQVAHVGITAVAGVGVGDDERPVIVARGWRRVARRSSAAAGTADCGPRSAAPHQAGGFVGHLAQRIAGQVGPGSSLMEPLAEVAQPPR